jgi:hypothetical protein
MKRLRYVLIIVVAVVYSSCSSKDVSFPNYKYSTVYFPYQSPIKTLVLGEDIYDNTMDNEHKCLVMATMGGVYKNNKDITINVSVDDTLGSNLKFDQNGDTVIVMPSNYYSLPKSMNITIPAGSTMGGLEVQLTDAFFADPRSIKNTFIIPLRMNSVQNADSILSGKSSLSSPDPRRVSDWITVPKNYTLYAVKYINPWHGNYLRRGVEEVKGADGNTSLDTTISYHAPYVEKDEVCSVVTTALDQNSISLNAKTKDNVNIPFQMILKFDNQGKCTITNSDSAYYTLSGTGEFVKKGDMWGNEQRDVLHLKYQVNFGTTTHNFTDTIVLRERGVKMDTFNPAIIN